MYKRCPSCGFQWLDRDDLLSDENIVLVGYQINFMRLEAGIVLFNHSCKGTLALSAVDFTDLYDGAVFERKVLGTDSCPGHCLHEEDFRPCPVECECGYVRNILHKIKNWPKRRIAVNTAAG